MRISIHLYSVIGSQRNQTFIIDPDPFLIAFVIKTAFI